MKKKIVEKCISIIMHFHFHAFLLMKKKSAFFFVKKIYTTNVYYIKAVIICYVFELQKPQLTARIK